MRQLAGSAGQSIPNALRFAHSAYAVAVAERVAAEETEGSVVEDVDEGGGAEADKSYSQQQATATGGSLAFQFLVQSAPPLPSHYRVVSAGSLAAVRARAHQPEAQAEAQAGELLERELDM